MFTKAIILHYSYKDFKEVKLRGGKMKKKIKQALVGKHKNKKTKRTRHKQKMLTTQGI